MGLKRSIHISLGSFSLNKVSQTLACTESPGNLILNCPFLGPPPPEILTRGLYRAGPGICILTTVPGGSAGAPGISPLRETRVSKPRPDYTQPWAPWKSASTHCGVPRGGRPVSFWGLPARRHDPQAEREPEKSSLVPPNDLPWDHPCNTSVRGTRKEKVKFFKGNSLGHKMDQE